MNENEISYIIRGAIMKVHYELGPGLLESVYVAALTYEIRKLNLNVKVEVRLPVIYDETSLGLGFSMDILVENTVVIEVKSIEALAPVHHKQLLTYLKLAKLKLGILVNFNVDVIKEHIFRKVNGL